MADALISIVLQQVIPIIKREFDLVEGVKEEVKKLEKNLKAISQYLADAEQRQLKDPEVKHWLDDLKDVSYRMDDVLDEWSTAVLKLQVEGDHHRDPTSTPKKWKIPSMFECYSCCRKVAQRHETAYKIEELNENLIDIIERKERFDFVREKVAKKEDERRETIGVIDIANVHSREQEKMKIVNLMGEIDSSEIQTIRTVSISGMGGIGKTTLAQYAFNHDEVKRQFNKRIWVCVSKPFDSKRIANDILESLSDKTERSRALHTVVTQIKHAIEGHKFLLVLDDMWGDGPDKWEQLKDSLLGGLPGSKLLVTTRFDGVARQMGCRENDLVKIGKLSQEACWSIFSQFAFRGRDNEKRDQLESIGREIVKKCDGLPLAAKALGSLCCSKKSVQEWRRLLNSELWELKGIWESQTGLASLWLSYYDLSSQLKQCFSYCAIFPEDHEINKYKLIQMWMAQGYLGKQEMETYGEDYFQELAGLCFFQDFRYYGDVGEVCKMHDIMRDFAIYLRKDECVSLEVNDSEELTEQLVCREARHLRIVLGEKASVFNSISTLRNLRSLWVQSNGENTSIERSLSNLFNELTCLRSLILSACGIKEIPSSISKLIHLRLLDLSLNSVSELSDNVCELYNLQSLDVTGCSQLKLPQRIEKLINLRHLYNKFTISLPKSIGRLTSLKTLTYFRVCDGETDCSLGDLKNLNKLQGKILIDLSNADYVGAEEAQLNKKTQLTYLILSFGSEVTESRKHRDGELIKALEPSPNLEKLTIRFYQCTKLPLSWVSLNNLSSLVLSCSNLEYAPPLGKLPLLETLFLSLEKATSLGVEFLGIETRNDFEISSSTVGFPKLKVLILDYMSNLEVWDLDEVATEFTIMPHLAELKIIDCPKLKALPNYLLRKTTLERVIIENCPILKERYNQQQENGENWISPSIRLNEFL